MITGIDHIDIAVDDVVVAADFFVSLGCKIVRQSDHEGLSIELQFPGEGQPIIELTQTRRTDGREYPPGLRHIGFRCQDIAATYAELSQKGMKFSAPPKKVKDQMLVNTMGPDGKTGIQIVE